MRHTGVLSLAFVVGFGASLLAQAPQPTTPGQTVQPGQPQPPTRTPQRAPRPGEAPPKGTAIIRGQVLAAGSGTPIRRAQVRAMSAESRSGGVTSTNNDGLFEIKELPAGRYTVSAAKGGYVAMQFGQRRPGEPGTPIELIDAQTAEKVNFAMARGGVIAGRIVDDMGEPVVGVNVAAMRYAFQAGARRLTPAGPSDRTDDQGGYRLYGLAPGDYYVSATGGFGMGNVVVSELNNTETDGYAPTYYPGTSNIAEAQRVAVKAGQEIASVHFAVTPTRLARVRGRALNSRGEPVSRAMVMAFPSEPSAGFGFNMNNSMVGPDGSFQLSNIAPGRYNITVRPMGMPSPTDEFAMMPVVVGSEDIDNVLLATSAGAIARGVVVTDDGTPPPFRANAVQIFAASAEPMTMSMGTGQAIIKEDFTFEIPSLFDRRLIRWSLTGVTGWYLKAVYFDGDDVTDAGVEFTPGRVYEGLQVVMTQKTTDLSGLLTDDRGRPVLDATVVVFPTSRDHWSFQSRYLRTARPDTEGRYRIRSLPPGDDYMVIAVKNLEPGQSGDPEFLTRALEEAKRFTLNEGETKAVDVKLSALVP